MKTLETKYKYIEMRAAGISQKNIALELGVSRQTCNKWEHALSDQIFRKKQENLEELYTKYHMVKTARIEQLGETINLINAALDKTDWSLITPDRLLKLKLDYMEKLRGEFSAMTTNAVTTTADITADELLAASVDLLNRIKMGVVTSEQAAAEQKAISSLITAYENVQTKKRIDAIEAIIDEIAVKGGSQ